MNHMMIHNSYTHDKDTPIYFVSHKILLQAAQLQNWSISLSISVSVPVHHTCNVANQVRAYDVYHLCVTCVHWQSWAFQNCTQQYICMPVFLSFTCAKHIDTCLYWHTCVKFKLSCTVIMLTAILWVPCAIHN